MEGQEDRSRFRPDFEMFGPMWAIHQKLVSLPVNRGGSLEERTHSLEDELSVIDTLARYTYFYDGNDLDSTMTVFHQDCLLVNPRGTYRGKEAVRRNYAYLISQRKFGFHYASNIATRILEGGQEGWMTAYYYYIEVAKDGSMSATGGTYADRLVKVDGKWEIIERRITYNYRHALSPEPPIAAVPPPEPSDAQTSRDIIGPDFML